MPDQTDHFVRELGRTRLALRADLQFTPRTSGDESYYTIEDPLNSRFYRLGLAEYAFVSLLDGETTVTEALRQLARARPDAALTEQEAAAIAKWLVETCLAFTPESAEAGRLADSARSAERRRFWQRLNPAVIRLPLFHPDRFFATITPWISWLYSPAAVVACSLFFVAAAYQVFADWDRFRTSSQDIFTPHNWLWLAVSWIALKLVHETSHGVVCKRYGGTVREAGALFILLAPVAYVDVTSSWRFRSKWQRIFTAAAGMYVELWLAAAAAFVWSRTGPGPLNLVCSNVVVMASFTTIVFNANPLMKYDGYYMLSDLLDLPNLYSSGQQCLQFWSRRWLLGVPATLPRWSRRRGAAIRVFGVASLVWRVVFSATLLLVAATYFRGAGVVLSCVAGLTWFGVPVVRFANYLVRGTPTEQPNRVRFACTAGLGTALISGALMGVPWPGATEAPAVVEYSPLSVVRASSPGFVREVLVEPGQRVAAGELLAVLDNEHLIAELADLELAQQQSQLKLRTCEKNQQIAAFQAELENAKALDKKHREKQQQVDQLTIRATSSGTVIGRNLENWLGRYAKAGTEILSIGNDEKLELELSIAQDDLDCFAARLDRPLRVQVPGVATFRAALTKLNPRASLELSHDSFAAPNDGPLAVHLNEKEHAKRDDHESNTRKFELLSPRFTGTAAPSAAASRQLRCGQQCIVTLRPFNESIGRHLYRRAADWMESKLRPPNDTGR